MSSKDAKEESTKSDYDDETIHVPGSTVESSKKKELKRFDFITEDREHVHLTKEQISAQKKIEEEAKAEAARREGEIRKEELIDLLGPEVVKKYYNDKLQKGPITLKVYREDDTSEIIPEFKASDLHLGEWREVVTACPNKKSKGGLLSTSKYRKEWTIFVQLKLETGNRLRQTSKYSGSSDRLNDLGKQERKHADDIHDFFRANKRLKSSVQYKDHPAGTVLNELVISWLPTDGPDGPNDIVFRVHYNGMFFFDPLGYDQGRVDEMEVDWDEEEASTPFLRSPPLKTRTIRNLIECRVLFRDQHCIEDEHLEHGHPLTEDESFALNEGDDALQDHYGYLRSYAMALANSNEGTTVKLGVTVNPYEKTYFDRFYVCFQVGRDGNNHIFPIAWAVVTVENKDKWSWFLDLLVDDLEVPNGNGLTLIFDQHKGLIKAVKEIMPLAEHRQCARQIYEGFKKQFGMCYEAVENGFSECFNSVLVSVRHKPIITMLESMRVIIMERMNTMRHLMEKWNGEICPNIQKILELRKDQQRFWHVIPCGGNLFEIKKGSKAFRGHNKSTCKKDPISVVPKEKGKSSRPKKQQNMETVPEDNEILTFMHNPRDEMGALNSLGVFDDRRVNNKKRGRMAAWFGIDPVNSDTIENIQAANAPFPTNNTQDGNIPGTQQSQVLPTTQESTRTERPRIRRVVSKQMLQIQSKGAAQRQAK
ncbi:pentatricopeptide repeat-containing protein [Tanacetum coccineum]